MYRYILICSRVNMLSILKPILTFFYSDKTFTTVNLIFGYILHDPIITDNPVYDVRDRAVFRTFVWEIRCKKKTVNT